MKNGSQKGWWSSGLISFDDIAVLVTDDINTDLDDFVIEEAGPQYILRWWNSPTARAGRSEKLSAGGLATGWSTSEFVSVKMQNCGGASIVMSFVETRRFSTVRVCWSVR